MTGGKQASPAHRATGALPNLQILPSGPRISCPDTGVAKQSASAGLPGHLIGLDKEERRPCGASDAGTT